jgi:hypothetical protein
VQPGPLATILFAMTTWCPAAHSGQGRTRPIPGAATIEVPVVVALRRNLAGSRGVGILALAQVIADYLTAPHSPFAVRSPGQDIAGH